METQLTKENIQLIRNFLQKNGVAHTDILQELTDHVASACEVLMKEQNQSFLTVFVPYMRVNGAVLIDKAYPLFDFVFELGTFLLHEHSCSYSTCRKVG